MGRKSTYNPAYCDQLIYHMSTGGCFKTFAGVLGVKRQTLYYWMKKYPDFKEAKGIGEMKLLLLLQKQLRACVLGDRSINYGVLQLFYRNVLRGVESQMNKRTVTVKLNYI